MRFFLFSFVLVVVFATSLDAVAETTSTVLWKCNTAHCTTQEWSSSVQTACDNYKWAENNRTFIRLENFWLNQWYCIYENDSSPGVEVQGYFTQDLTVTCTLPQTVDETTASCVEPPQCTPPSEWSAVLGICVQPQDCSDRGPHSGPITSTIQSTACFSGCAYTLDYYEVLGTSGFGHYLSADSTCTSPDPVADSTLPEPIPEDPIAPTDPIPELADDGDQVPDPATDEGQEHISKQLGGVQDQLGNLEQSSGQQTSQGNITNSLLTQIANQLQEGSGTGDSGLGTGDEDGDGEQDSFSEGQCVTPPYCNGNVLQCAIASMTYQVKCALAVEDKEITESEVMANLGITDTLANMFDFENPDNQVDVQSELDLPSEPGAFTCPPDWTFNTQVGPVTFTLKPFCDLSEWIRPIVIMFAYLTSAMMLWFSLIVRW